MNTCPIKRYCPGNCSVCTDEYTRQKVYDMVGQLKPVLDELVEKMVPLIRASVDSVSKLQSEILAMQTDYPNRRVFHLAFHHPKEKVRKKNLKIIERWESKKNRQ